MYKYFAINSWRVKNCSSLDVHALKRLNMSLARLRNSVRVKSSVLSLLAVRSIVSVGIPDAVGRETTSANDRLRDTQFEVNFRGAGPPFELDRGTFFP